MRERGRAPYERKQGADKRPETRDTRLEAETTGTLPGDGTGHPREPPSVPYDGQQCSDRRPRRLNRERRLTVDKLTFLFDGCLDAAFVRNGRLRLTKPA